MGSIDEIRQTFKAWAPWGLLAATILSFAFWAGAIQAQQQSELDRTRAQLQDVEQRMRAVESTMTGMAQDIRWIRRALEQR